MIQTVIFDMDGVIVDTEPVHHYAYFKQFAELDIFVSEEIYTSFTGNSTRNTFQKLKNLFSIEVEAAGSSFGGAVVVNFSSMAVILL